MLLEDYQEERAMRYYLRDVVMEDLELLFQWVNDIVVRQNAFSSQEIIWEKHRQWFEKTLHDKKMQQYIFVYDGVDVGQIRMDIEGEIAEIDYSIASKYRCMGYAKLMVCCLAQKVKKEFPNIKRLIAQVKPENIASQKVFLDVGYKEKCYVYELALDDVDNNICSSISDARGGVVFLTNNRNAIGLYDWIVQQGVPVTICSDKIDAEQVLNRKPDLIISYNYKKIVHKDVIDLMDGRIINLHISLLPWNRGFSPNVWSFLDGTPKGVTIHQLDEGLDTGDIIWQEELTFNEEQETFVTSYQKLHERIVSLFKEHWNELCSGSYRVFSQTGDGSYHSLKDLQELCELMEFHYTDNVAETIFKYKELRKG